MAVETKKRKTRDRVAAERGRLGGLERKRKLSRKRRREIAVAAARARWDKPVVSEDETDA